MIRSDAGRCPVSAQCGILGVAKSTCHWMLEHPEAERADPYEKDVERVWRDSGKVYGARKIRHALGHEGVTLSRRRINRIMKGNGMAGSCSKAAYRPRPARPNDDPAPDILAREFNGYAPRTHLASDPAYVRVGSSWAYVCLPGDLASRQIAGHSVGVGHDADLVPAAFAALRASGFLPSLSRGALGNRGLFLFPAFRVLPRRGGGGDEILQKAGQRHRAARFKAPVGAEQLGHLTREILKILIRDAELVDHLLHLRNSKLPGALETIPLVDRLPIFNFADKYHGDPLLAAAAQHIH